MSSTEQKNVSQPFISSCYSFGILPTLISNAVCQPGVATDREPFTSLGKTTSIGEKCRCAEDPIDMARRLFPVLDSARPYTYYSALILKLASDARCYSGNQGVLRFVESILSGRWGLHFAETNAIKHAKRHVAKVSSYLAPGAYGESQRTEGNVSRICHKGEGHVFRVAADVFDYLVSGIDSRKHRRELKSWCGRANKSIGFRTHSRTNARALADYNAFDYTTVVSTPDPPAVRQKLITVGNRSTISIKVYVHDATVYIKIINRYRETTDCNLTRQTYDGNAQKKPSRQRLNHELYVFSTRDLKDITYLLQACAQVRLYFSRRLLDVKNALMKGNLQLLQKNMWSAYLGVMRACGNDHTLRNKLGVYFDVLQWRYLAWKSGDVFYDHSYIMGQKIKSKGLVDLPRQELLLTCLRSVPLDLAVDILGMYKASIYPEVDPFMVVADQLQLHLSRFDTRWEPKSPEDVRFQETKAYMWYLGIRVLYGRFNMWPGRIRDNVETKPWHLRYKRDGVPGNCWRDAHDVDLRGVLTVADISDEQYFKQQDSACAPPLKSEYANFAALRNAPRRHRRKLLYAIQENDMVDLRKVLNDLNTIGAELPDGYVDRIDYDPPFSTDIVTGSRCERHKDSPRPFYAASPPWGCILSYFDGITRDFLGHVPQSMMGKSTRQKFMDLSTTAQTGLHSMNTFYMSDDKAKYSPRMDPNSQQLPADFFAEVFDIPGMKAFGPVMYHCDLYYRVHGHLVHYNSNGTDREGMRGASNTWLEIVAQGLSTRICRERKLIRGKSTFLAFIDDGLRKFTVEAKDRTPEQIHESAKLVIQDVIFGLRVLGRELSWDKTFISRDLFVILNELVYDGVFISSGLKSFCSAGDVELKPVMTAADYEQLYFGKMRGARGVGAPLDICHYSYVFDTLMSHAKMGVRMQDNRRVSNLDYRLFCMTPVALGGGGMRSALQLSCNEVANATKEGMGNLVRLGNDYPLLMGCVASILDQPLEQLNPIDFMREPEQFHVAGPRLKTQRLAAEVRKHLGKIAGNAMSREYLEQDALGMQLLKGIGRALMATGDVNAEEVRLLYSTTPVAFIDEFVQKLASSVTLAEMLSRYVIGAMRRLSHSDLYRAVDYFHIRSRSRELVLFLSSGSERLAFMTDMIR